MLLHDQVLKVVSAQVEKQFADALRQELTPLEVGIEPLHRFEVLLPLI